MPISVVVKLFNRYSACKCIDGQKPYSNQKVKLFDTDVERGAM